MDPLTQILALLRPKALAWKPLEIAGDWAIRFPANTGVVFVFMIEGSADLARTGHPPMRLESGDYVLMVAPPVWTMRRGSARAVDYLSFHGRPAPFTKPAARPSAPRTRLVGGYFALDDANAPLLAPLLPPIVELRGGEASAQRISDVLALLGGEAMAARPGRSLVLERLLEIMLVEAIRDETGAQAEARGGLLAGLADAQVAKALRALHSDIRRDWTVAALAAAARTSRSVLAERFRRIVGLSPIDYLRNWRMALAKDALRSGRADIADVAFDCGYRSVSAFSTAFARTIGCPPGKYAANARRA